MADRNVQIQISATDQATGPINAIQRKFSELNAETDKITRRFTEMNVALSSLLGAVSLAGIGAMTKSFIDAGLQMEKLGRLFAAAAGNANLGAREMEYIKGISEKMGLSVLDASESYGKWMAAIRGTTLEGEKGRKVFESVSGATTALGLSADETKGIFTALQQMMSKGKVQAEELRGQLGERLPGAYKMMADAMGITTAELDKQLKDGKVLADVVLPKLAEQLDKTYGKAAAEGAKSTASELNKFNSALFETKSIAGEALMPAFNAVLKMMRSGLEELQAFIGGIQILAVKAAAIPDRIGAAWQVIKTGKGLGSFEGQAMYAKLSAPVDANVDAAINDIMKKFTPQGSSYTAAELAAQNAIKPQKLLDDEKAEALRKHWEDVLSGLRKDAERLNPSLNKLQQQIVEINSKFEKLSNDKGAPGQTLLELQLKTIKNAIDKFNEEVDLAALKHDIKDLEDAQKSLAGITGLSLQSRDVLQLPAKYQTPRVSLLGLQQRPAYSLMSASGFNTPDSPVMDSEESKRRRAAFGGLQEDLLNPYDRQLVQLRKFYDDKLKIIQEYEARNLDEIKEQRDAEVRLEEVVAERRQNIEMQKWENIGGIISGQLGQLAGMMDQSNAEQFAAWKALAIGQATIATAMAVAGILGNEALSKGMLAIPLAITAGAIGMAQIGMIAAQKYQGREFGGPVTAGQSYIVGEKRPELFTPGVSGTITPFVPTGGGTQVTQHINIDARGADAGVLEKIRQAMKQARAETEAAIMASMNRGSSFALASGRTR
jgi:tape measure domain-containing protein